MDITKVVFSLCAISATMTLSQVSAEPSHPRAAVLGGAAIHKFSPIATNPNAALAGGAVYYGQNNNTSGYAPLANAPLGGQYAPAAAFSGVTSHDTSPGALGAAGVVHYGLNNTTSSYSPLGGQLAPVAVYRGVGAYEANQGANIGTFGQGTYINPNAVIAGGVVYYGQNYNNSAYAPLANAPLGGQYAPVAVYGGMNTYDSNQAASQ